jgi:hypothetical protein
MKLSPADVPEGLGLVVRPPVVDVIDTILTVIANGTTPGDNVKANDVPSRDQFPFLAAPHQPLPAEIIDDNTRN